MKSFTLVTRLALFNFLSKIIFSVVFLSFMPFLVNRISLIQTDNDLVEKREQVIKIISETGIEPFITDTLNTFGSYNILKEEFISLEKIPSWEELNFIEIDERELDSETISYRVLNYSFEVNDEIYLLQIGRSLDSILQARRNIRKIIVLFLVFMITITFISDNFFTELLVRPLKMIVNKLKHTATPSLFDRQRVRTSTSDFIKLDNALIELMNRVDELISKEKEITVNMSHELLTPVSVIRGKLENLLLKENIDNEVSERVEDSLRTLHRLTILINSLLFFSRIESQQYLKEDTYEISELIKDLQNELEPIASDREICLKTEGCENFTVSNSNRSLMFSMFYNVINNAIKNTGKGGSVTLKTYNGPPRKISVSDTGNGIPPDRLNDLFTRFKKINPVSGSNGIGLAITKSIADFHNIGIEVESTINTGTKFFFRFPENS